MISELLLLSNNDIPFAEAQINIHNPTLKEIALISEESFHLGCQFLNFSLNLLNAQDKSVLSNKSDFEVFMSIINGQERSKYKVDTMLVLTLLFPNHKIKIDKDQILLQTDDFYSSSINNNNFDAFKKIISEMFVLNEVAAEDGAYNPADAYAKKIAEKFKKRKEILAKQSGINLNKIAIFSRYVSILAVGEHKDINSLMEYTVYQLKDEFKRFQMKHQFDFYMEAKLAGAQDLEEVDNWMDDIHP